MEPIRIGDEVWHIQYGNGKVIDVDRNLSKFSAPYPIKVVFPHDTMRFTAGGKDRAKDRARTLFHGHDLKVTVNEKKPKRGKDE